MLDLVVWLLLPFSAAAAAFSAAMANLDAAATKIIALLLRARNVLLIFAGDFNGRSAF
jgi:hypothetical protein